MKTMSVQEADNHALHTQFRFGKYGVIKWFMVKGESIGNATHFTPSETTLTVASGGYPYGEIWSARAFGIVNRGWGEPTVSNYYTHCAVINLQNGKIEWRNYEA